MRHLLLIVLLLLLTAVAALEVGCEKRVTRRRGIGDPLYRDRPPESSDNIVRQKYDDGAFER